MLQSVWNRSDRLASWTGECFELFWKETLGRSSGLTAFRVSLSVLYRRCPLCGN